MPLNGQTRMPCSLLTAQAPRTDAPVAFSAFWDILERHDELEAEAGLNLARSSSKNHDATIAKVSAQLTDLTQMVRQALRAGTNPSRRAPPTKEICRDCIRAAATTATAIASTCNACKHHAAAARALLATKTPTARTASPSPPSSLTPSTLTEQAQAAAALTAVTAIPWPPTAVPGNPDVPRTLCPAHRHRHQKTP